MSLWAPTVPTVLLGVPEHDQRGVLLPHAAAHQGVVGTAVLVAVHVGHHDGTGVAQRIQRHAREAQDLQAEEPQA